MKNYVKHYKCHYDHTYNAVEFTIVDRLNIFFMTVLRWKKLSHQLKRERFGNVWTGFHRITFHIFHSRTLPCVLEFNTNIEKSYYLELTELLRKC